MDTSMVMQIINLLGLCGLGWLIHTLKGTVHAQKTTIDAQKAHIESMANFLNIADAPKMAERYEAYKKILDAEKEAYIQRADRKFQEDKKVLFDSSAKIEEYFRERLSLYYVAVVNLASMYKVHALDWEVQKDALGRKLRDEVETFMNLLPAAPLLSPAPLSDDAIERLQKLGISPLKDKFR